MSATYRVERAIRFVHGSQITDFAIIRSGDGELVRGSDPVLLYRIADLLNEERRQATREPQ